MKAPLGIDLYRKLQKYTYTSEAAVLDEINEHQIKTYKYTNKLHIFSAFALFVVWFLSLWVLITQKTTPAPITQNIEYKIIIDKTDYNIAIDHIKQNEGLSLTPYEIDGYTYIGYGHLITSNDPSWYKTEITEYQADWIMRRDLFDRVEWCSERFRVYGDRALALGMLFYNVSPSSIMKSDLYRELFKQTPDKEVMKQSWLSMCRFQGKEHAGLKKRRQFEIDIFFGKE